MNQIELIAEIKRLCNESRYDEAIALTNQIDDKIIAVRAHLLCIKHERRRRFEGLLNKKTAGKLLQALRDVANEHESDTNHSELFAVGAVLLLVVVTIIYAIYSFVGS